MYIYSFSLDCDAKWVDVGLVGELFFLPNLHLLTLLGKQVDVGLARELFFPPNLHLLTLLGKWVKGRFSGRIISLAKPTSTHSSWKMSRCRFGGNIIFPAKPISTHPYLKTSRCRFGGMNNSTANFTSACFYSDFHSKQVDVKLVGKIIMKSSLNAPNNHQTYHCCHCQCCCCIFHPCCHCLNLSPVWALSLVALPLLWTLVSLIYLLILEIPLYLSTNNTSWINYYYLNNANMTDALILSMQWFWYVLFYTQWTALM